MNLFQQAMYRDKIQSRQDKPIDNTNRDIMCSIGKTGVKAGSMSHGMKWKNHKYLYIDANGKYVYPEDVAKNAKDKVSSAAKDLKTKLKDKKFKWDSKHRKYGNLGEANANTQAGKKINQLTSAHQEGTKKFDSLRYINTHESGNKKVKKVTYGGDWVEKETVDNVLERRKKVNQQRKSAHAGYERNQKIFPDGGSTEKLEEIKARKKKQQRGSSYEPDYKSSKSIKPTGSSYEPGYKSSKSTKATVGSDEYSKKANSKKKPSVEDLSKAGASVAIAGSQNKNVKKAAGKATSSYVNEKQKKRDEKNSQVKYDREKHKYIFPDNWTEEDKSNFYREHSTRLYLASEAGKETESEKRKRKNAKRTVQAERRRKRNAKIITKAFLR